MLVQPSCTKNVKNISYFVIRKKWFRLCSRDTNDPSRTTFYKNAAGGLFQQVFKEHVRPEIRLGLYEGFPHILELGQNLQRCQPQLGDTLYLE